MALISSTSVVEQTLDLDINYVDHYNLLTVVSKSRKMRRLLKDGYRVKSVKFLYGLDMDRNGSGLKIGRVYALITLVKEGCELLTVFVDVVRKRVTKVFHVKKGAARLQA